MNVLIVVDETPYYVPAFMDELFSMLAARGATVQVMIVTRVPEKSDLAGYIMRNFQQLTIWELLYFGVTRVSYTALTLLFPTGVNGHFFSVASVCRNRGIDYELVRDTINDSRSLARVREFSPDVIVSSNSLIFGRELLGIPRLGCLNRHSSLLPSYGGLWPVLHAIANGEKEVGVSVHSMAPEIDKGNVLAQEALPVSHGESLTRIYHRCFAISAALIIQAIERLESGEEMPGERHPRSYYSFPTNEDWREFRRRGGRFV